QGSASKISTKGQIEQSTDKGWTFKGTSGDLTVEVNDLDLGSLEPLLTWAGVELDAEGKVSADIKSEIQDGRLENLNANIKAENLDITGPQLIKAENLDITGPQLKGDRFQTNTLDVHAKLVRQQKMISIENLDITADWLNAQATGMVPATFDSFSEFLQSDSNLSGSFELDVAQVFSQMPQTFGVKEDMKVTSGKLSGAVSTATETGKRKVTGNAILEGLKGTVDGNNIALEQPVTVEAEITAEEDKIIFDKMDFTASFGTIDCSGTSESLKYTADVDLTALQAQIGQFFDMGKYQFAGQVVENGTISTQKQQISAVGSSTITNLGITSKDGASISEPQAVINFDVGYDRENRIVNIDSLNTTASFGQVDINDAVIPLDTKA
ncbi:MAG: translocation/assembly module TamB domain-containing protein, partial [Planctomycetota bacterium]